jgi:hypothetical protein
MARISRGLWLVMLCRGLLGKKRGRGVDHSVMIKFYLFICTQGYRVSVSPHNSTKFGIDVEKEL